MDLAAVFLLPLLGGYCFAYVWRGTSFRTKQLDGQHLNFRASLCGVVLFSLSLALHSMLVRHVPAYANFDTALVEYAKSILKEQTGLPATDRLRRMEWVIAALYSIVLGIACGPLLNWLTPKQWALQRSVGAFYECMLLSQREGLPISLILNTGKVYVGITLNLEPLREPMVVTMLPMFSGSQDSDGRVSLTTDYVAVYKRLRQARPEELDLATDWHAQFELSIRADQIVAAAPFSPAIYSEFNPGWRERIARQATQVAGKQDEDFDEVPDLPRYVLASSPRGRGR